MPFYNHSYGSLFRIIAQGSEKIQPPDTNYEG